MNVHQIQGHAAVLTANTIFGLGVPVTALLLSRWIGPLAYMETRCVGAALVFWLISLFLPREHVPTRDLAVIIGGGLIGVVVSQTLTAWSLTYTTPVYLSLIATLTPVATMLCAALFIRERITKRGVVGVAVGIVGALLMVFMSWQGGSGRNDLLGILLAVLSLLTWAVYLIITRSVSARYSAVTQMKWIFLASAVVMLPFSWGELATAPLYTGIVLETAGSAPPLWTGILEMAFIVLLATVYGYFAIPFALRYVKTTTVSIYTNLQPVIASFVAISIGQDQLTWDKPVALFLVLLSAWIVTRRE